MKTRTLLLLALLCLPLFCGCSQGQKPESAPIPPARIEDAFYPPGELDTITITGEFFKMKSTEKMDVEVSLNGQHWLAAKKILESSPTVYVAQIPYGVSFPQVWVRVYGMDGEYSRLYLAHVQRN